MRKKRDFYARENFDFLETCSVKYLDIVETRHKIMIYLKFTPVSDKYPEVGKHTPLDFYDSLPWMLDNLYWMLDNVLIRYDTRQTLLRWVMILWITNMCAKGCVLKMASARFLSAKVEFHSTFFFAQI